MKGALPIWWNRLLLYSCFKSRAFTANLLFWVPDDKRGVILHVWTFEIPAWQTLACYGQPENKPPPYPPPSPERYWSRKHLSPLIPVVSSEDVSWGRVCVYVSSFTLWPKCQEYPPPSLAKAVFARTYIWSGWTHLTAWASATMSWPGLIHGRLHALWRDGSDVSGYTVSWAEDPPTVRVPVFVLYNERYRLVGWLIKNGIIVWKACHFIHFDLVKAFKNYLCMVVQALGVSTQQHLKQTYHFTGSNTILLVKNEPHLITNSTDLSQNNDMYMWVRFPLFAGKGLLYINWCRIWFMRIVHDFFLLIVL